MLMNPLDRAVRYRDGIPVLPGAFPLLGHVPSIYHDALELLRWGRDALGPLFWMVIGPSQLAVTYTERDSLELLKNRTTTNTFLKDYSSVLVGESLLGQDGKLHQHMRTAMNGPFTPRGLAESGVGSVLADLFVTGVDRWAARRKITILTETQELALSAIFRIIGIDVADLPTWRAQYRDFVYSISPLPA